MTGLSDVVTPELVTETELAGACIEVRLVGCADGSTLREVRAFVDALHVAACAAKADEVLVDLRTLEFASASCLGVLAGWLGHAALGATYTVRFLVDARLPSQRRSIEPLVRIDPERIRVDAL